MIFQVRKIIFLTKMIKKFMIIKENRKKKFYKKKRINKGKNPLTLPSKIIDL